MQSALGEPLRAEVDFLDINTEEAATLSTRIATPEAFKAAGLEYNAALGNLRTSLQRRANGRAFLKLSSDSVVNDPFVDLILEASWNSGRIVRDYTLLFDPPNLRSATAQATDNTQLAAGADASPLPARTVAVVAPKSPASAAPAAAPQPKAVAQPKAAPQPKAAAQPVAAPGQNLRVQPGQTAGQIAAAHLPDHVSLDQMLVAMLRSNPDAFIKDNVNRLKAGAVLTLPPPSAAALLPAGEATQIVIAQSRDFNEFRRKLADNVGHAQAAPAAREAAGRVQAAVREQKPASATPDKLTLSKGSVQGKSGEDKLAKTRNAEQTNARTAELAKNITDLNKLALAASAPGARATPGTPAAWVGLPAPTVSAAASAPAITAPAVVQAPASTAKPAPKAAAKPSVPASVPEPEAGFIDALLSDPVMPAGAAALLALLAALGVYKRRQRNNDALLDSALTGGGLAESSSGGQSVDTSDDPGSGSSMVYSPSQMDSANDVDPLAEADVYLAYGRDLQAEEILKDALRSAPESLALHAKLADIYAKRGDAKSLEAIATQAFNLADGAGPQWEHICENGLSIDPDNALYLPGGQPGFGPVAAATQPANATTPSTLDDEDLAAAKAQTDALRSQAGALDALDLDLDFSLEESGDVAAQAPMAEDQVPMVLPTQSTPAPAPAPDTDLNSIQGGLDFTESDNFDPVSKLAAPHDKLPDVMPSANAFGDFNLPPTEPAATPEANPAAVLPPDPLPAQPPPPKSAGAGAADADMLSFDIDSLSLDLADDSSPPPAFAEESAMDPLETKLALAEEFRAIGDDDGARALIEEVIAEATGDIQAKAQTALAKL